MASIRENLDVSRETLEKLETYVAQIEKWQKAINLIARSTAAQIWDRHIIDSAQLFNLLKCSKKWVDLGSGGGLPGIVVSILAQELCPEMRMYLVDSDARKCEFLRSVSRDLDLPVHVYNSRIDTLPSIEGDVVSARALAPLVSLLGMVRHHRSEDGVAILPKGRNYQSEITEAETVWRFRYEVVPSITNSEAVILKVGEIEYV